MEFLIINILPTLPYYKNHHLIYSNNILSWLQNIGDDERLSIMKKIFANEKWYILEKTLDNNLVERIVICQTDNTYYFISLYPSESIENSKIFNIHMLKIK